LRINIKVVTQLSPDIEAPRTLLLAKNDWNDWWNYQNQYYAEYKSDAGTILELGLVKVENPQQPPQPEPKHPLDVGFQGESLDPTLVSLGQSDRYYEVLASLPDAEREAFSISFRDAVWDPRQLKSHINLPAVRKSLLRAIPISTVLGEFRRTLRKEGEANYYHLKYQNGNLVANFVVSPTLKPRTNLHVLIGRNGVGKTTILRRLASIVSTGKLYSSEEFAVIDEEGTEGSNDVIAGVQYVSWGPFDKFNEAAQWTLSPGVSYAQIGLDGISQLKPDGGFEEPEVQGFSAYYRELDESVRSTPPISFARIFGLVLQRRRNEIWLDAVAALESDPEFKRLPILDTLRNHLSEDNFSMSESDLDYAAIAEAFSGLSEGHQAVLLTISYVAATLAEQTLVILDEPEAHLHPPLLSSLIRCLNDLLARKNAMGIVATHSPVVLQEVPRSCALKITGRDDLKTATRPRVETFGEDIGALTHEVFELEVEDSGFYRTLRELASRFDNFDDALRELDGQLGISGRSALRTLIALERANNQL